MKIISHPINFFKKVLLSQQEKNRQILLTAIAVSTCVSLIQGMGTLQTIELETFDRLSMVSSQHKGDQRIVIVGINESDIQQFGPQMSDEILATLLQKIQAQKPRAIGLDIYRSRFIEPGSTKLKQTISQIPHLIAIEKIPYKQDEIGIPAPEFLHQNNQVGFNNVVIDIDGKVRRNLLYWHFQGRAHKSFALSTALVYLKAEKITPQQAPHSDDLQLGKSVFRRFEANDGGYIGADNGGYQILAKFRGPAGIFETVSVSDVLENRIREGIFTGRIVLIGSTAASMKDLFYTPYSSPQRVFGVEVHANFISQILTAALEGRSLIKVWSAPIEWLVIFICCYLGANLRWRLRTNYRSVIVAVLGTIFLIIICYGAFLWDWWLPVIPLGLGFLGSMLTVTGYLAHLQEEFKKSKEFLYSVINTIPDPIFVKDKHHNLIVLNQAYCKFLGYPYQNLIEKSEADFFSPQEVQCFWQQDEEVFQTGLEKENEETFTNAQGHTYQIATKRSLHKDSAGNLFLVGIIRDITQRKRIEEELKQRATELARSNEELKMSQNQFRYLAYHDPLTGLPNRKLFEERLCQSLEWAMVNHQKLALLFLDLDGFKAINDEHGHDVGDLLLKAVAERLTSCLRGSDTVCRLGGDEFTVILTAISESADAIEVAKKILLTLSEPFLLEKHHVCVTSSIGISLYPLHAQTCEILINRADAAMYQAKAFGKNTYEMATQAENSPA